MSPTRLQDVNEKVWPQRLLRIKDWTSYQVRRTGDDVYYAETDKNPEYAILSYTWGRYRADGGFGSASLPAAEAIDILGTSWSIPKIAPVRGFGRDVFKAVIKAAAQSLDYIWLDVACIDQQTDTDKQIGQQVSIFHRASSASIWLHQQRQEDGGKIADAVKAMVHEIANPDHRAQRDTPDESLRQERLRTEFMVNQLLYDPWFSSLWTLQESFLRKDATILARDGGETFVLWKGIEVKLSLQVLLEICKAYLELDDPPGNFHILQPIKEAGLDRIGSGNALVLLSAARQRTAIKMNDRILGIQQIFGVDVSEFADRPLAEMEQELSLAINVRCPAMSQAFLHPSPVPQGRPRWQARLGTVVKPRIYSSDQSLPQGSVMPHRNTRRGRHTGIAAGIDDMMYIPPDLYFAYEVESPYRATVLRGPAGMLQWSGLLFPLEELWRSWKESERTRCPPGVAQDIFEGPNGFPDLGDPYINAFDCSMYLDDTWVSTPEHVVNMMPFNFSRYSWPLMIARQFCISRPSRVEVLILGKIGSEAPGPEGEAWIGLLVKLAGNHLSDRIGFCTWREDIGLSRAGQVRLLN
jgi:hypothetical protein